MKNCKLIFLGFMVMAGLTAQTAFARTFADIDVIGRIKEFNKSVLSTRLDKFRDKMQLMAQGTFPFLRGTAHLMNLDMEQTPGLEFLRKAPVGLIAGDLHMHNFSVLNVTGKPPTYAIDDLDEAYANAPLSFDVFRLSVSLVVGFFDRLSKDDLTTVLEQLFAGYCQRADDEQSYDWPKIPMPEFVKNFVAEKSDGKWAKILKSKTLCLEPNSFDYKKHEPVPAPEKKMVTLAMTDYLSRVGRALGLPAKYTGILDISQRYDKGLSSIGLKRYFILLRGESDSWKDDCILEVKIMRSSSVSQVSIEKQAKVTLEAMTRAHQGRDPFLGNVFIGRNHFLVRQGFPWSETIENTAVSDVKKVSQLAFTLGYITADFHSQSGKGSSMKKWLEKTGAGMIPWVFAYADQLKADWKLMKKADF